jgi:rhodanese-related sulfurtransferase
MTAELVRALPLQRRTVDDLVAAARARLHRLSPADAAQAVRRGALLVDIRPHAQRVAEGEVPGALVLERNVLEWRLDPSSDACLDTASYDLEVVVLCSEGWTSSLAAAALQELGVHRATDVVGGFQAWRAAALPTTGGGTTAGQRSGSQPPVLHVDAASGDVLVRGRTVDLTRQQHDLLTLLHGARGTVVPRELAAAHVGVSAGRTIDVVVFRLRQRLGSEAAMRVVTVRGRGFRLLP